MGMVIPSPLQAAKARARLLTYAFISIYNFKLNLYLDFKYRCLVSIFLFVRVVLFPSIGGSKLTPVAYPNPSQAKDRIFDEAVDGDTTTGGS